MGTEAPPGAGPGGGGRTAPPGIAIGDEPTMPDLTGDLPGGDRPGHWAGPKAPRGPRKRPARRPGLATLVAIAEADSSPLRIRRAPAIRRVFTSRPVRAGRPPRRCRSRPLRHSRRPVSAIPLRQRLAYGVLLAGGLFLAGRFAIFWFNPARLPRDFGPGLTWGTWPCSRR